MPLQCLWLGLKEKHRLWTNFIMSLTTSSTWQSPSPPDFLPIPHPPLDCLPLPLHLTVSWCVCRVSFPPAAVADSSWTSQVCTWGALEALKENMDNRGDKRQTSKRCLEDHVTIQVFRCDQFHDSTMAGRKGPLTLTWLTSAPVIGLDVVQL